MRLINESDVMNRFIKETEDSGSNGIHINTIKRLLSDIPDAYRAKKVVKEMKEIAIELEVFGQCSDYVELSHAIDIVKQGGVGGDGK